jgi:predicted nucleotidyltransferase
MKQAGVAGLYLFGSFARDQASEDSDIDIFIDKADPERFGFENFMTAYGILRDAIPGREIGYTTREGLVDFYRSEIEKNAIRIF